MSIKKITPYLTGAIENPGKTAAKTSAEERARVGNGFSSDRVEISKDYHDMAQATKTMAASGDLRTEKIEQVRNSLENGDYVISPEEIAGKMMEEAFL